MSHVGIYAVSYTHLDVYKRQGLFLGVPGSGKSFAAKRELVNVFLATRDRIIVVDPMGDVYKRQAQAALSASVRA